MTDDELYRIAKERAEGKRPNVPWRKDETDEQRRERWNAANPQDPIPTSDDDALEERAEASRREWLADRD